MNDKRLAVVTGANRGIGFEIARQLARKGLRVVLTSRQAARGRRAQRALADEGLEVMFHPLDVTARSSISALKRFLERQAESVGVLVNNAGIMQGSYSISVLEEKEALFHRALATNFFGALRVSQAVVPLMQRHGYGRVVNLSSGLGQLHDMGDGSAPYRVSKTALNALTRMLATATEGQNILVNSMCPGWVRTDMGGANASRSVEKGAETAIWLSLLPDGGPSGGFFRDKKPIPW